MFSLLLAAACGGTSVRHVDDEEGSQGGRAGAGVDSTNAASGGFAGGTADGGTGGMRAHPTPAPCAILESALTFAKRCTADEDCGQLVQGWPCALPDGLPPVVNLDADVSDLLDLVALAESRGECPVVTYGCNNCIVEGYGCFAGTCDWRSVDCGPPP
jgi:hypothetical protein